MRFLFISFLVLLCSFSGPGYSKYCNGRFDFCIEYPSDFIKQPKPDNDDGLTFLSADKKTEIKAFGSLVVEDIDELNDQLESASSGLNVTYKTIKKDWFIISGTDKQGNIVYRKTIKKKALFMGMDTMDVFQTLMIRYPVSQKDLYNTYCQKIAKSL